MKKLKFEYGQCPMCLGIGMAKYCNGGCWDDLSPGSDGTEHLHWTCGCNYEWLTPTAETREPKVAPEQGQPQRSEG